MQPVDPPPPLEIFAVTHPGLEQLLRQEASAAGFTITAVTNGGVTLAGGWPEVWRANLTLRGATRILVRLAAFRAFHLAQLDKRARKLPWTRWLRRDHPVRVETVCRKSRIYHERAASQRIEGALEASGLALSKTAEITLKLRIEDDLCTLSLDSSGAALHKRGLKQQINKAPMRETLASLFLRAAGYRGKEPVFDPMCGSGTFPIEAAEIAAGLLPGRVRHFAFEHLASFDPEAYAAMPRPSGASAQKNYGSDRDAGAIRMSVANAALAGLADSCQFTQAPISAATRPDCPLGLVIVNPPYGKRIGNRKLLYGLYGALGAQLKREFVGWRVALVTSETGLARATELPFKPPGPHIDHGGTRIRLWQTAPL